MAASPLSTIIVLMTGVITLATFLLLPLATSTSCIQTSSGPCQPGTSYPLWSYSAKQALEDPSYSGYAWMVIGGAIISILVLAFLPGRLEEARPYSFGFGLLGGTIAVAGLFFLWGPAMQHVVGGSATSGLGWGWWIPMTSAVGGATLGTVARWRE